MSRYKFSKDILKLSAGNFKQFVKGRYPELSPGDLSELVEEHYGKDTVEQVKEEKKDGNSPKPKGKPRASTK